MAKDNLPTVWPAGPHTLAKHAILRRYLGAWFPILSRQGARVSRSDRDILYVDGFAGPGAHSGGEPGSPVIALRAAIEHHARFPSPINFLFVENDSDRFEHLRGVINAMEPEWRSSRNVREVSVLHGDCSTVLRSTLSDFADRGATFGPALAFLDQFGYSDVPIDLICSLLRYPQCEVFSYLHCQGMNRWISDASKAPAFQRAFGGDEWEQALNLPERQQRDVLLRTYKDVLSTRAGARYVQAFTMFDDTDRPLYWLIFCTQNLRGLEEMKRAMWSVDETGEFRFSDCEDPAQLDLLSRAYDASWLADQLARDLAGRTVTVRDVWEHVLVNTPCYLHKPALRELETKRTPPGIVAVDPPPTRRRGYYADEDLLIRFADRGLF